MSERAKPITIAVTASKGIFVDVLAEIKTFLGDPDASVEENRAEVERLAEFLEYVAAKFREDSIEEFGDGSAAS
jgi:hypothetical protein